MTSATATDILPTVREGVAEVGATEDWEKSVEVLAKAIDVGAEEAETILAEGLKWKGWAIVPASVRRFQRPVTPDTEKLEAALAWLTDGPLTMDQAQLASAIKSSPKVYLVEPEETYKEAIGAAPDEYKDASVFKAMVLEDPTVMECTYNCKEDGCASECGSCWVSYARRA